MAKVKTNSETKPLKPALTPEAEEDECIALAYKLVKQRLQDGSATSQETTHFLRMGTREARLKNVILEKQAELTTAKTEQLHSQKRIEELYADAVKAMKNYSGQGDPDEY